MFQVKDLVREDVDLESGKYFLFHVTGFNLTMFRLNSVFRVQIEWWIDIIVLTFRTLHQIEDYDALS
jgi:hypothetical protein